MERADRGRSPKGTQDRRNRAVGIQLLGDLRVSVGSRVIEEDGWRLGKAGVLVAMLALAPGHRLHREQIMDALWPDLDARAASNNFHRVLHAARRTLAPGAPTDSHNLELRGGQLALCPEGQLHVDVEAFERVAAAARRSQDPAAYRAAIELYAGDLLPGGRHGGWARERRHQLRRSYLQLLSELAELEEERGEGIGVIGAQGGGETHDASARRYRKLERAHRPSAGARLFREDATPDALTMEADRGRTEQGPAEASGRHNLPEAQSSFVGRQRELAAVRRALRMTSLLTLTGTGGAGKTRLALEAAGGLAGASYPGGVWLVELAALSDAGLVGRAAAAAVGARERPGLSAVGAACERLGGSSGGALVVLDNCEHVIDGAASLAETLLMGCPGLTILATSREPLGVPGESVWPVPTLSVPDDGGVPSTGDLLRSEAVRLFVERARSRLPGFTLSPENAGAVASVCRKLDGIPLAIELAVARMGALAVEQVAQRLDDSLGLLSEGVGTVAHRHQTLRATLDWSYGLLGEDERALFRRLSVFVAGFTLAAAEEVCAVDDPRSSDVLLLLSRLVDRSLVIASGLEGEPRYRMLTMVNQYAREKLRLSGEEPELRSRHAAYFLSLAEMAEPELTGAGQEAWLDRLDSEMSNLRAAIGWSTGPEGSGEVGLRLSGALWRFCYLRGHYAQGRDWLEGTLALGASDDGPSRARALMGAGVLALLRCEYHHAERRLGEGLALYRALEDERGVASVLQVLGSVARERGRYAEAEEYHRESLILWLRLGDEYGVALSRNYLGFAAWLQGKRDLAARLCTQTLEEFRRLGDAEGIAWALISLGSTSLYGDDLARAETLLEEGLLVSRRVGYREGVAWSLNQLGVAAYRRGDHELAEARLRESLAEHRRLGDRWRIASVLEVLAQTAIARDDAYRALKLLGAAQALREEISTPIPPCERADHDRVVRALRRAAGATGQSALAGARAEGRSMSLEQAADFALGAQKGSSEGEDEPRGTPTEAPVLTRRQREVALLVADGLTNRQIASRLALAESTVANHVAGVMGKLNLTSRSRIAVWVAEGGLPAAE